MTTHGVDFYWMWAVCDITISHHIRVSKQRFGEVCWHNMHIILHYCLFYVSLCWLETISAPS